MKITLIVLAAAPLFFSAPSLQAQALPASEPHTCIENLDALAAKLYDDYAGFRMEVVGAKKTRYDAMLGALRERARSTASGDCLRVLDDYLKWFEDPHVFLYQNDELDPGETARRAASVRKLNITEADARHYFRGNRARLDPIEGIWYDRELRVAILKDPDGAKGSFVAVVLQADTAGWPIGSVRASFTRGKTGSYSAKLSLPNHLVHSKDATVYRRVLLRIAPTLWAKAFPVLPADSGSVAVGNPRRPVISLRPGTVVITIPSHDPSYKPELDSLIAAHRNDLLGAKRIIVDVRGNEGGSSQMSDALLPYILSSERRASPYSTDFGTAVMLSSPDQISYAKRAFGSDTSEFVRSLVTRMQAHPGELVPLRDPTKPAEPERPDSVLAGSWKVGVLIDRGTVSASEVIVLKALQSRRATVFGEPTEGALDYQTATIRWFSPKERRWGLGYPTITANAKLPEGGMRGKGIQPDVRLDYDRLADPVAAVEKLLDQQR